MFKLKNLRKFLLFIFNIKIKKDETNKLYKLILVYCYHKKFNIVIQSMDGQSFPYELIFYVKLDTFNSNIIMSLISIH